MAKSSLYQDLSVTLESAKFKAGDRVRLRNGSLTWTIHALMESGEYMIERNNVNNPSLLVTRSAYECDLVLVKKVGA